MPEQFAPPLTVDGAVAVARAICAAALPLLVNVTFFGLVVPLAVAEVQAEVRSFS